MLLRFPSFFQFNVATHSTLMGDPFAAASLTLVDVVQALLGHATQGGRQLERPQEVVGLHLPILSFTQQIGRHVSRKKPGALMGTFMEGIQLGAAGYSSMHYVLKLKMAEGRYSKLQRRLLEEASIFSQGP